MKDDYAPLARLFPLQDAAQRIAFAPIHRGLLRVLRDERCANVLDVGCGTGRLSGAMTAAGMRVVGVDRSPSMLKRAQEKRRAAELHLMDAAGMPFEDEFDAAVISLALHEMAPLVRGKVWERMRTAVRPGGVLIAIDASPPRPTRISRLIGKVADGQERDMGRINPEHYTSFREFMASGGISSFVREKADEVVAEHSYFAGNLTLIVARVR